MSRRLTIWVQWFHDSTFSWLSWSEMKISSTFEKVQFKTTMPLRWSATNTQAMSTSITVAVCTVCTCTILFLLSLWTEKFRITCIWTTTCSSTWRYNHIKIWSLIAPLFWYVAHIKHLQCTFNQNVVCDGFWGDFWWH